MALTKADIKNIQQGIKSTVKDAVVEAVDPFEDHRRRIEKLEDRIQNLEDLLAVK